MMSQGTKAYPLEFGAQAVTFKTRTFKERISIAFTVLLIWSAGPSSAQDAKPVVTMAAAQTAKQQCLNVCSVRYRDCLALKQISPYQCRNVYRDCSRIACTNLRI